MLMSGSQEKSDSYALVRSRLRDAEMTRKTPTKITVLLSDEEFDRFDSYCRERGYKKSTLIARLIRQYLDLEGYGGGGARLNAFTRSAPPERGK